MLNVLGRGIGVVLSAFPPSMTQPIVQRLVRNHPQSALEAVGPLLNREPNLDNMPYDLEVEGELAFENLAGLFASSSLDHGVVAMTIRQVAYLYGYVKKLDAPKMIEVGRYKGGATFTMAAAMGPGGKFWSIDIGEKEERLEAGRQRKYDDMIRDALKRHNLEVELLVGDSFTIEVDTGEVDVVFIDGDHSYEGVKNDFERFGRRVKLGGSVFFDDCFSEKLFTTHVEEVGRLVKEIEAEGKFRLVKGVDRLAHIERIAD